VRAVIIALLAGFLGPQAKPLSPAEILRKAEATAAALASFQADFEQTFFAASADIPHREKGRLTYEKPGRMRWEYLEPKEERKTYVYKEGLLLSFYPDENQLIRQRIPEDEPGTEVFGLLSGRGGLAERYLVEDSPFPGAGGERPGHQIKLTPRDEEETSSILLEIDPKTFLIRRAVLFDWAGNKNEFVFSRLRANPRLASDAFEIKVPPDCEIIDDAPPRKR
jgi:outer membrane lipoprotein-sorting protein